MASHTNVILYGMGKLGRELLFEIATRGHEYSNYFEVVGIVDTHSLEDFVDLLKFDFTYRDITKYFPISVEDNKLIIGEKRITYFQVNSFYYPEIQDLELYVVGPHCTIDCSGAYGEKFDLGGGSTYTNTVADFDYYCSHAGGGYTVTCLSNEKGRAGSVTYGSPIYVKNLNDSSMTSSMTNICIAWPELVAISYTLKILNDSFGINYGVVNCLNGNLTSSILTNYNAVNLLDGIKVSDNWNQAGRGISLTIPELNGKIASGYDFSYPIGIGSFILITAELNKSATTQEIAAAVKGATNGTFANYFGYYENDVGNYLASGFFKGERCPYFISDKLTSLYGEGGCTACVGFDSTWVSVQQTMTLLNSFASIKANS